jgi:KDO2-lipid IV(A) lauroyltransferase
MSASHPAYPGGVRAGLQRALLLPLAWIGRGPLRRAQRLTGWLAGPLRLAMRRRARIVRRNLALCFPDRSDDERRRLEAAHFRQLAEAVGEIAVAWHHAGRLDESFGDAVGLQHVEAARAGGQGVLLLTAHVTCLEIGARLVGERIDASAIYRPLSNPVLEVAQARGRARYARRMIPRKALRDMVRHLRGGGTLWYAPDQDLGPERSRFAPFFGIETATATGLVELARLGRARVVPMMPIKDPDSGRVRVHFEAAFDAFPSGDDAADLARFNAFVERHVRAAPAQYWWLHRRFKSAPDGSDRYAGI